MHKIFKILIALVVAVNFSLGDEYLQKRFNFGENFVLAEECQKANDLVNKRNAKENISVIDNILIDFYTANTKNIEKILENNELSLANQQVLLAALVYGYMCGVTKLENVSASLDILVKNKINFNAFLQKDDTKNSFLFSLLFAQIDNPHKKLEIIKLLQSKALDIKAPISHRISTKEGLFALYVSLLNYEKNGHEIFEYFAKNKVNPENTLMILVDRILELELGADFSQTTAQIQKISATPKYEQNFKKFEKYLDILVDNYKIDDFNSDEILIAFIKVGILGDENFGKKLAKMGLNKEHELYKKLTQNKENKAKIDKVFLGE